MRNSNDMEDISMRAKRHENKHHKSMKNIANLSSEYSEDDKKLCNPLYKFRWLQNNLWSYE